MISKFMVLLVCCVSLFLAGCGKGNPMVGTWALTLDESAKKQIPAGAKAPVVIFDFKGDDTFSVNADFFGQKHTAGGTYKLDGKSLTLTMKTADGEPSKNPTPQTVTLSEDGKSFEFPNTPGQGKMVKQ